MGFWSQFPWVYIFLSLKALSRKHFLIDIFHEHPMHKQSNWGLTSFEEGMASLCKIRYLYMHGQHPWPLVLFRVPLVPHSWCLVIIRDILTTDPSLLLHIYIFLGENFSSINWETQLGNTNGMHPSGSQARKTQNSFKLATWIWDWECQTLWLNSQSLSCAQGALETSL